MPDFVHRRAALMMKTHLNNTRFFHFPTEDKAFRLFLQASHAGTPPQTTYKFFLKEVIPLYSLLYFLSSSFMCIISSISNVCLPCLLFLHHSCTSFPPSTLPTSTCSSSLPFLLCLHRYHSTLNLLPLYHLPPPPNYP